MRSPLTCPMRAMLQVWGTCQRVRSNLLFHTSPMIPRNNPNLMDHPMHKRIFNHKVDDIRSKVVI